jgi:cellulose biosynthesis protein BcsQ
LIKDNYDIILIDLPGNSGCWVADVGILNITIYLIRVFSTYISRHSQFLTVWMRHRNNG